jgi:hypothetical protein
MCVGAALAGANVEHLCDCNADGADGNHERFDVFGGEKEASSDQQGPCHEENYRSNVAVLIDIGPDDAIDSKSYPKCQQHSLQQVRSQKLHSDQGQNGNQHRHCCAVDGTSQAQQCANAVAAVDSFMCVCVHSVFLVASTYFKMQLCCKHTNKVSEMKQCCKEKMQFGDKRQHVFSRTKNSSYFYAFVRTCN